MESVSDEILGLAAKKLRGELDKEGETALESWLSQHPENRIQLEKAIGVWERYKPATASADNIPAPPWRSTQPSGKYGHTVSRSKGTVTKRLPIFRYAAVLSLLAFSALLWWRFGDEKQSALSALPDAVTVTIDKGESAEVLALDDLTDRHSLSYDSESNAINIVRPSLDIKMMRVDVPRGERVRLKLADGTAVNLNSSSSIQFPDRFSKGVREVKLLAGEAFFNVTKGKNPFIVRMGGLNVKVLGTEFNVANYKGEDRAVTLTEGKVALYRKDERESEYLEPGMQALIRKDNPKRMIIREVDTDKYSCWKDDIFRFENNSLDEMETRLERWFDVEIDNRNKAFGQRRISGDFDRGDGIETLLEILCDRQDVRYTIRGKRVNIL
ncbi:iron dicitrate transporter FecR (plasmid) [Fulvitalea axinellae]|uniref:Iron dicitrate transporter FecR n=1 Tax=Fulvitalea axinellae TaxID=1182444 RepID=A0AAU9D1J6_9BACT|nr:iron dicitrate transporter FecR [Fulvitalea axinellae]